MSANLENRTALVTGAGRGIGRAIATGLARTGTRVGLLATRNPDGPDLGHQRPGPPTITDVERSTGATRDRIRSR